MAPKKAPKKAPKIDLDTLPKSILGVPRSVNVADASKLAKAGNVAAVRWAIAATYLVATGRVPSVREVAGKTGQSTGSAGRLAQVGAIMLRVGEKATEAHAAQVLTIVNTASQVGGVNKWVPADLEGAALIKALPSIKREINAARKAKAETTATGTREGSGNKPRTSAQLVADVLATLTRVKGDGLDADVVGGVLAQVGRIAAESGMDAADAAAHVATGADALTPADQDEADAA